MKRRKICQASIVGILLFLVLVVDQMLKVWVKTNMHLYESIHITDWFQLYFIENNGMAYGMEFLDKYFLTGFRIVAVTGLLCYIGKKIYQGVNWYLLVCLALVTSGAAGNIVDCVFYGIIFNDPQPPAVAHFVSYGYGYQTWFQGKVVDMLYFPLFHWPEWMPVVGGNIFFSPVFNFADACISVGVFLLLIYQMVCRKR